jgi:gas vesicle protein
MKDALPILGGVTGAVAGFVATLLLRYRAQWPGRD